MNAPYRILINQSTSFERWFEGWRPGDPLRETWAGEVDLTGDAFAAAFAAAETLFRIFNIAHPDGYSGPSLSVGDVVIIGELAFAVRSLGFDQVTGPFDIVEREDAADGAGTH